MPDLVSLGADVEWTDHEAGAAARAGTDPALGRLADLAEFLAETQGTAPPRPPEKPRLVLFGAAAPAAVARLAADLGMGIRVADETDGDAVSWGAQLADDEVDSGADLLLLGFPDPGATAAIVASALTNTEPVKVLARGAAATDPQTWMGRAADVRDARRRAIALLGRPQDLLVELNRPALAAATGFALRAAGRRTPLLIDGPAAAAAALIGQDAQPRATRWWLAADRGTDPAYRLAITKLGLRNVLDLDIDTGDGTAALLALPVLRAACELSR